MTIIQTLQSDPMTGNTGEFAALPGFLIMLLHFTLNFAVVMTLARWLYYSSTKRKDYLFTYILISSIVFFLCYSLENVNLQLGFALGLFAIFGILRYRTDTMPIREMTYLFIIIGISVINSLSDLRAEPIKVVFINVVIVSITVGLEKIWLLKHEASKLVIYEKINLIGPEHSGELLEDLQKRTGIKKINRFEIGKIDLLRDTCEIRIFYDVTDPEGTVPYLNGNKNNNDDD